MTLPFDAPSHAVVSSFTRWTARSQANLWKLWELSRDGFQVTVKNKVGPALDALVASNRLASETFRVLPGSMNEGYRTWTSATPQGVAWITVLHDDDEWMGSPALPSPVDPSISVYFPLLIPVGAANLSTRPWRGTDFADAPARMRRYERAPLPSFFGAIRGDVWTEWDRWLARQPIQWHSLDLQLNLACVIMGQQGALPGFSYAYDTTNWTSGEVALSRGKQLYEEAGIPPSYMEYDELIIRLNSLSLLSSLGKALPHAELLAWSDVLLARLSPLTQGRTALIAGLPSTRVREAVVRYRDYRSGRTSPRPPSSSMALRYAKGLARAKTLDEVRSSVIPSLAAECPALVSVQAVELWDESISQLISLVNRR